MLDFNFSGSILMLGILLLLTMLQDALPDTHSTVPTLGIYQPTQGWSKHL